MLARMGRDGAAESTGDLSGVGTGAADTELIAFRVGHDDPPGAVLYPRIFGECRTERLEPRHLVIDVRRLDVEVHPVLAGLRFANPLQQELWLLSGFVDEEHVVPRTAERRV